MNCESHKWSAMVRDYRNSPPQQQQQQQTIAMRITTPVQAIEQSSSQRHQRKPQKFIANSIFESRQ